MNLDRRSFLLSGASLLAAPAFAQSTTRVDVAKVMSFTCPISFSAEAIDPAIQAVVAQTGGQFVAAPVPTETEALSGAKERVYYAARAKSPQLGEKIKRSLYKGGQDLGVPLNEYLQVYTWLSTDLPEIEGELDALFQLAQEGPAGAALTRAVRLATSAGVSPLPGYVLISKNQIAALVDLDSIQGTSLLKLRDEVISRINQLSKV